MAQRKRNQIIYRGGHRCRRGRKPHNSHDHASSGKHVPTHLLLGQRYRNFLRGMVLPLPKIVQLPDALRKELRLNKRPTEPTQPTERQRTLWLRLLVAKTVCVNGGVIVDSFDIQLPNDAEVVL